MTEYCSYDTIQWAVQDIMINGVPAVKLEVQLLDRGYEVVRVRSFSKIYSRKYKNSSGAESDRTYTFYQPDGWQKIPGVFWARMMRDDKNALMYHIKTEFSKLYALEKYSDQDDFYNMYDDFRTSFSRHLFQEYSGIRRIDGNTNMVLADVRFLIWHLEQKKRKRFARDVHNFILAQTR